MIIEQKRLRTSALASLKCQKERHRAAVLMLARKVADASAATYAALFHGSQIRKHWFCSAFAENANDRRTYSMICL